MIKRVRQIRRFADTNGKSFRKLDSLLDIDKKTEMYYIKINYPMEIMVSRFNIKIYTNLVIISSGRDTNSLILADICLD